MDDLDKENAAYSNMQAAFFVTEKQIAIIYSLILFVEGFVLSINQRKDASLRSDYVLNKVNDRLVGFTYFRIVFWVFKQELSSYPLSIDSGNPWEIHRIALKTPDRNKIY